MLTLFTKSGTIINIEEDEVPEATGTACEELYRSFLDEHAFQFQGHRFPLIILE